MAGDAGTGDAGKKDGHGLSLETRIALIGVLGALAGTLVGGLVTWAITQDQISTQKEEARRSERLDAYSQYFGDAARFWTQALTLYEVTPPPTHLNAADAASLQALQATLTQEYARVSLLAPKNVHAAAQALNSANTRLGNALESVPIDAKGYLAARNQIGGSSDNLLRRFSEAAKEDLGTR